MLFAPLEGWRDVKVTDRHAAADYAQVLKDLADTHFPDARRIVLVQDNLSTHKPASLYEVFPAAEARRLAERFEWHYTAAQQLAGHGRVRTQRAVAPMPRQEDPRQADPDR